jgi:hypothetical protein
VAAVVALLAVVVVQAVTVQVLLVNRAAVAVPQNLKRR